MLLDTAPPASTPAAVARTVRTLRNAQPRWSALATPKRDAIQIAWRWLLRPRWRRTIWATLVALGLLILGDVFVCESVLVPSSSMEPTILPNERVLLLKVPYRTIRRFDVVVIRSRTLRERIAKRVIGVPGDRIRIDGASKVILNGRALGYAPLPEAGWAIEAGGHAVRLSDPESIASHVAEGGREVVLGPHQYYVLGDNRPVSRDSRFIGPVSANDVEGKMVVVWYSFDLAHGGMRWSRILHALK